MTFERTLDAWVGHFSQPEWRGSHVQGWLFEGVAARRAAEQQLARAGVHARLHSAYKPLVHHFLEKVDLERLQSVRVRYPLPPSGPERRFALEAYPLGALLPPGAVQFEQRQDHAPWYEVQMLHVDGRHTASRVFAPNRQHADATGAATLSPGGWLRVGSAAGLGDVQDGPVLTDYEQLFAAALDCVRIRPWPDEEPWFERLELRADVPGFEQPVARTDETISTLEGLHEDLYFSLMEVFQQRSGRPPGDRRLQPGQIVPDVRGDAPVPRLRIHLRPFARPAPQHRPSGTANGRTLDGLTQAPAEPCIVQALRALPGRRFRAATRQGRTVHGVYQSGWQHPVFLSAGQHANETSGIVGVLRAANMLRAQPGAHFALLALENPDGYALHQELCRQHPGHMHHAARYTALGDDVEYRERPPLLEREARQQALALSGAQLHVNLHGYPAHEWTRPLSGYAPRGFEQWMLPKGFFLILRHHAGWQRRGRALLRAVCAELAQVPGLMDFNQYQRALYECHAGPLPHEVLSGTPCMQVESAHDAPVTLITEFPDETVRGAAFVFAHTVQMHATLAAVRAWQAIAIMAEDNPALDAAAGK